MKKIIIFAKKLRPKISECLKSHIISIQPRLRAKKYYLKETKDAEGGFSSRDDAKHR
ncbi:MAG: hypothetical protein LUO89_09725 [Methanothrix sp.]|nr:hypothetical protein [Methanothrix sp.]